MEYEVYEVAESRHQWRVEAIDHDQDGQVFVTIFSGPEAKERAEEYAAWKNQNMVSLHTWEPRKVIGYRCTKCFKIAMQPHQNFPCRVTWGVE